jgi:hypothetical protein
MSTAIFGSYIHSDAITPHKGAALAVVRGAPAFAQMAAMMAYGASAASWAEVLSVFPDADSQRAENGAEIEAMTVVRLGAAEAGRVELIAGAERASIVKVASVTDFGAKTDEFRKFSSLVAEWVLKHGVTTWLELVVQEPTVELHRASLSKSLKEKVEVAQIEVLTI